MVNCIMKGGDIDDQDTIYVLATKDTRVAYLNQSLHWNKVLTYLYDALKEWVDFEQGQCWHD
jgi:hypothetical protein